MPPCLSFGIGTKAENPGLGTNAHYLISQPRFLHFTLNQHNRPLRMPPSVMPKGVEHANPAPASAERAVMPPSVMPKGVEHPC